MHERREASGTFKYLGATTFLQLGLLGFLFLAPSCETASAARVNGKDRIVAGTAISVASPALRDAASELLALQRKHGALATELTEPRTRSFDAIAAELAEVDGQYQRSMIGAGRLSPELARVLAVSSPDDQEQRLLAVTSGLLKVATATDVQ